MLVVADVTNWSEDEGTLDVKKFGVRPSGERKPTGISQKWTGVAHLVRGGGTHSGHIDDRCVPPGGGHASSRSWASVARRDRCLA